MEEAVIHNFDIESSQSSSEDTTTTTTTGQQAPPRRTPPQPAQASSSLPPCVHNRVGGEATLPASSTLATILESGDSLSSTAGTSGTSHAQRSHSRPPVEGERQRRRRRISTDLDQTSTSRTGTAATSIPGQGWVTAAVNAEWWWRRRYGLGLSIGMPAPPIAQNHPPPFMDSKLWSSLPDDLIEKVLTWLPIPAYFRFRSVCKRWRTIMYTKGFTDMCSDVPPRGPFFLKVARCRCRMLAAYYPPGNKWLNIPISFLPSQVSVPAASSKGLMCFIATQYVDGYSVLLVCNPLTRCWKALPPMTTRRYPFVVALITDRKLSAYKVVVAGDYNSLENRRTTEVYDSVTSTWKQSGPLPREEEITKNIVACNGYLFCLSRGPGNGLLAYSLQQENWIKVRTGRMPGYSKFRHLIECNGRILIVGKALRKQVLGLYVWHLDPPTMRWKELAKMPQLLSEQFFRTPSECFFCSAYRDQIFISRFFCDLGLIYNISHDTWQWIPDCPKIANPFILTLEPGFDAVY